MKAANLLIIGIEMLITALMLEMTSHNVKVAIKDQLSLFVQGVAISGIAVETVRYNYSFLIIKQTELFFVQIGFSMGRTFRSVLRINNLAQKIPINGKRCNPNAFLKY